MHVCKKDQENHDALSIVTIKQNKKSCHKSVDLIKPVTVEVNEVKVCKKDSEMTKLLSNVDINKRSCDKT